VTSQKSKDFIDTMAEARNHAETTCPDAHCQIPEDSSNVKTSYILPTILFVGSLCSFMRAKWLGLEAVSSAAISETNLAVCDHLYPLVALLW